MQSLLRAGAWDCTGYRDKRIKHSLRAEVEKAWSLWRNWRTSNFWSETNPREKPIPLCRILHNVDEIFQKLEKKERAFSLPFRKRGVAEAERGICSILFYRVT